MASLSAWKQGMSSRNRIQYSAVTQITVSLDPSRGQCYVDVWKGKGASRLWSHLTCVLSSSAKWWYHAVVPSLKEHSKNNCSSKTSIWEDLWCVCWHWLVQKMWPREWATAKESSFTRRYYTQTYVYLWFTQGIEECKSKSDVEEKMHIVMKKLDVIEHKMNIFEGLRKSAMLYLYTTLSITDSVSLLWTSCWMCPKTIGELPYYCRHSYAAHLWLCSIARLHACTKCLRKRGRSLTVAEVASPAAACYT